MLDFTEILNVAGSFFNQSDSGNFKLKQVTGYYDVSRYA